MTETTNQSYACKLKVWGDFACFTRPELKVERMSYLVPTPSSVRGIYEAILRKPQFRWYPRRITVLKPIQFIALRRNEVQGKISARNVQAAMSGSKPLEPLYADAMDEAGSGRTQRQTMALRDVAYLLEAEIRLTPAADTTQDSVAKYRDMFLRRVEKGQCFHQPAFGCREFIAHFAPPAGDESPLDDSRDLGLMLYDIFDYDGPVTRVETDEALVASRRLSLFKARLDKGFVEIPAWNSDAVLKAPRATPAPSHRAGRRRSS